MKRAREKSRPTEAQLLMCGAENVAALAIIGAFAQSLVSLGPKYEAAINSALELAAAGLQLMARDPDDGTQRDYAEALLIVQRLRAYMPVAKAQWPTDGEGCGHA